MSDYLEKLKEYRKVEADCERLKVESIAAKDIPFEFVEKTSSISKLCLEVPKAFKQYIQNKLIVSVAIEAEKGLGYVGTGIVKKFKPSRNG